MYLTYEEVRSWNGIILGKTCKREKGFFIVLIDRKERMEGSETLTARRCKWSAIPEHVIIDNT